MWVEIYKLGSAGIQAHRSHPHGCVSWNPREALACLHIKVTPSRVCELKSCKLCICEKQVAVTPSRVCELKSQSVLSLSALWFRHTLTGVWVEIVWDTKLYRYFKSHPHGCVSWNHSQSHKSWDNQCHTLTGVWVEIHGLHNAISSTRSHPHGCVSWNPKI